jgi:DNA-directed RNA polymerase specialized sigma24 family protein
MGSGHEKSVDEVAQILDVPPATVKTRMFYAPKKLAEAKARRCRKRLNGRKRMGAILWRLGDFHPLFF